MKSSEKLSDRGGGVVSCPVSYATVRTSRVSYREIPNFLNAVQG